ncbi:uncharacterized protein LOC127136333 [Lathyrus oleraceus]|uniref:uncharacterized protein LOC127136333 n=1 Tax=Pisum sativum TaxID=3888 RepID=UPI0021CFF3A6|nr:uncharacterized protein LOC127136333 [Pisum sativum]
MEADGTEITWTSVRIEFLEKYSPDDMFNKKDIEFLELKQLNMIVDEYVAKFEELLRFCTHYNGVSVEGSKCLKFESGLHPKIKNFIGYKEIHRFSVLVNKHMIYDEDDRAIYTHYKSVNENKNENKSRGKPYAILIAK